MHKFTFLNCLVLQTAWKSRKTAEGQPIDCTKTLSGPERLKPLTGSIIHKSVRTLPPKEKRVHSSGSCGVVHLLSDLTSFI